MVNQRSRPSFSSTALLKQQQLHWLSLEWHMQFKLVALTIKALHTGRPPYLKRSILLHHQHTTTLRSSLSTHQLFIPRHSLSFGCRAFRFSAPRIWNSCLSTFANL